MVYQEQGNLELALEHYEKSLEIQRATLDEAHPDVAISLWNLACVHEEQGNHAEALALYERSLWIYESTLGPEHPSTVKVRES
eukprot:1513318-Amphidinium_carterae.1